MVLLELVVDELVELVELLLDELDELVLDEVLELELDEVLEDVLLDVLELVEVLLLVDELLFVVVEVVEVEVPGGSGSVGLELPLLQPRAVSSRTMAVAKIGRPPGSRCRICLIFLVSSVLGAGAGLEGATVGAPRARDPPTARSPSDVVGQAGCRRWNNSRSERVTSVPRAAGSLW